MRAFAISLAVVLAAPAFAQVPSVSEPPPPPSMSAPTLPPAFFERFVHVDYGGQAFIGRERKPISRLDLFNLAGRSDLVLKSEDNRRRRTGFTAAAIALGVLTVGATFGLYISGPDLAGPACMVNNDVYNRCLGASKAHEAGAIVALVVGGAGTVALATLAAWANPDVLSRDETVELVSKYNAQLARTLKQSGLMLTPLLGPGQVGLMASLRFP